jgi:hypothetical protein
MYYVCMARLKILDHSKVAKINFLYWVNDRNMTDISKIVGHSVLVCERHRFKTRTAYETWNDELIKRENERTISN